MLYIFVNFSENNHHGCDLKCPFCEWSNIDYGNYYCPSIEDLEKLHRIKPRETIWQISGGGDPLYHYDKNKDSLKQIADFAHSHNHKIQLLTKKIDVVLENFEELSTFIDYWYFSVSDEPSETFKKVADLLNNRLNINIVLNQLSTDKIDWNRVQKIIDNYEPYVHRINFRENFIHPFIVDGKFYDTSISTQNKKAMRSLSHKAYYLSHTYSLILFHGEIVDSDYINKHYLNFDYLQGE